ncbi:hypothetical protein CXK99_10840 [Stutzerimonas stutzeri]|uniref:Uncharacterized protein n=1 Tax=Stutzerimonas stutzeri TaxID=316 RepID=A0A2N8REJ5_STUST|nr:hypothetical protein CXK99_10840 [Stutzerimonas stutzeri]
MSRLGIAVRAWEAICAQGISLGSDKRLRHFTVLAAALMTDESWHANCFRSARLTALTLKGDPK